MDTRFATATHILGYLAWRQSLGDDWVSSEDLGQSIDTHRVVVRRILSVLSSEGLIETRRGAGGGSRLAKSAETMHLGEVYTAINGEAASLIPFTKRTDDANCDVGIHIEAVLREIASESERAFRRSLAKTSVAEFSRRVVARAFPNGRCGD